MKRIGWAATVGLAVVLLGAGGPLAAQVGRVAVPEENIRAAPRGAILARVLEGTELLLGERQDRWREATLEAWIWGRSVREQDGALDLVVNADGENLRATPNGRRVGRAEGGMRLERLERRGDWLRVRRTAWIWEPSLEVEEDVPAGEPVADSVASRAPASPDPGGDGPGGDGASRRFAVTGSGVLVLDAPAGDTVARLRQGATVEVLAREGSWTRVRVEGWTFTGTLASADPAAVLRGISRDSLQAGGEAYRGRLLEWNVQFIALQQAERFRTDFVEGEPFVLARGPGEDPGFVYLAVAPEGLEEVRSLEPLERVRVLTRIRTVRSPLTGAPVLELLEIIGR